MPSGVPTQHQTPVVETPAEPEVSWDTARDHQFAESLRKHSGGLIKKAAVGIENNGKLRVEVSRAVEPEDTLALTKSLMAGARKDFPDRPLTLSLYDPAGAPIVSAHYKPGDGVHYQIAPGDNTPRTTSDAPKTDRAAGDLLSRGGVTARDQAFALWAEQHGRDMLRYVEADLEHHGRLWFGVTSKVAPTDVKPLTQSLLEGAHKEFPNHALVATVFDPEGQRIGRAKLGGNGVVSWE